MNCAIPLFCSLALLGADDFKIEVYQFRWLITTADNIRMEIVKTQDDTTVVLSNNSYWIVMTPADARRLGNVFEKTDDKLQALKAKGSGTETVEIGSVRLKYSYSVTRGLGIWAESRGPGGGVNIRRESAKDLAESLLKAEEMAKFFDQRIKP